MNYRRQAREKTDAIQEIWDTADAEDRGLSRRERAKVSDLIDEADELNARAKSQEAVNGQIRDFFGTGQQTVAMMDPNVSFGGERPGDAFVRSKGYEAIRDSAQRPSQWSSGPIEVKATLLEGDIDTPGEGAALAQADVRPGVQPVLFQPLTVASLIPTTQMSSNRVRVVVETVASDDAQVVAEGAASPSRPSSSMRPTSP